MAPLAVAGDMAAQNTSTVIIEGSVTQGESFARRFGAGFTFSLSGLHGVWVVEITHIASGERDLVYPVDPPYRFSNHRYIGPGYGESARDSAANSPRQFAFLSRPDDVGRAWNDLERVLWPYNYSDAEVERATDELAHFATGTLRLEILAAEFATGNQGGAREEFVSRLRFRATVTWPTPR